MTALLLAQLWMLGLGLWARRAFRTERPLRPGGWLALIMAALAPTLASGLALANPDVATLIVEAAPAPVARSLSAAPDGVALPALSWRWLALAYAAVTAGLLAGLLIRTARLYRQPSQPGPDGVWLSEADVPPHALGWPARRVVVPASLWHRLNATERDMLLAHERSHITRRDPEVTLALLTLQSVLWINPGFRALVEGWRQAVEMRADRAALRDHAPTDYARLFARLARGEARLPVPTATQPRHSGDLAMRLAAILSQSRTRPAPVAALGLALAATLGVTALAASPSTDRMPIKRIPPKMPASCPDLTFDDDFPLTVMADSITKHEDDASFRGSGNVVAEVGRVYLRFDVDAAGVPQNVNAVNVSAGCFRAPAVAAVQQWRYTPGSPTRGVENQIRFALVIEDGADVMTALEEFRGD